MLAWYKWLLRSIKWEYMIWRDSVDCKNKINWIDKMIAPLGFDPRTFGLWAQHASSAPRSKLLFLYPYIIYNIYTNTYRNRFTYKSFMFKLILTYTVYFISLYCWLLIYPYIVIYQSGTMIKCLYLCNIINIYIHILSSSTVTCEQTIKTCTP